MESAQEVFDEMLGTAVEDLRKSGLDSEEIFLLVEDLFGSKCARKFSRRATRPLD
jgi:hypothetical protein